MSSVWARIASACSCIHSPTAAVLLLQQDKVGYLSLFGIYFCFTVFQGVVVGCVQAAVVFQVRIIIRTVDSKTPDSVRREVSVLSSGLP